MKHSFRYKKMLSLLLAFIMVFGAMPLSVFAEEASAISDVHIEETTTYETGEPTTDVADVVLDESDSYEEESPINIGEVCEEEPYIEEHAMDELALEDDLRIDLLTFADFHGHTARASANDNDPGAAQLVAYTEWLRAQNPDPQNVFIIGGGDEFHGYSLSNFHHGRNVVAVFDYLTRNQDFNMHVALGNHEFSHGIGRAYTLGEEVTLLAADLFYQTEENMPAGFTPSTGYGERPSFVRPYDVIEFPDHDVTIGVIGLMNTGMRNLVSGGLVQFDLRSIHAGADQAHKDHIHDLIDHLRDYYGVSAVVAATHLGGTSGAIEYVAANFDFDAIIGGHAHHTLAREHAGTPIIEAGQHGRNLGRFSFYFTEEGDLQDVTTWLTPQNAIRDFAPRAAGEFGVLGAHAGHPDWLDFAHHYDAVTDLLAPFIAEAEVHFGENLGPVGIYFNDRDSRDHWVTRLNLEYVSERLDDPSVIAVSNSGGWRNTGMWPRTPESPVYRRDIYTTMPFENLILIHQMYGRDVNIMLNSMGSNLRTGVHGTNDAWYITATGERITPYGHGHPNAQVYTVTGSNHTWTQDSNTWRFPGNAAGNRSDMHVIAEPQVLLRPIDGEADPREDWSTFIGRASSDSSVWTLNGAQMLRDSMEIATARRGEAGLEMISSTLTVAAEGYGTAIITAPFAPGDRTNNVNMHNTRVTVTATPDSGVEFLGWFAGEELVATTLAYSFTITENTELVARFYGESGDIPIVTAITVEEARAAEAGETISVHGVVTTTYAPGAAGNAFFLQSPTGTTPESGILVRVVGASEAQLAAFAGREVVVTGVRNGNVTGNGFMGLENVTVANLDGIENLGEATVPEAIPVTLEQLRDRHFQSMLVSVAVPVEITGSTTGAGGDPNRVVDAPGGGNFVIWQDPVAAGFNVGDEVLINRGVIHWWQARNEVQFRIINPATDLELYGEAYVPAPVDIDLTVTLTAFADFHGMMNSENSVSDPGFARFVTFVNAYRDRTLDETGHYPVLLHAGDTFFGQSITNLMWGEPALRILNLLGIRYGSIGNHEFSWQNRLLTESFSETDPVRRAELLEGVNRNPNPIWEILPDDHPLNVVEGGIPFLAADLVYEDGHPRAGEHPDWLQPYAVLDDWYETYGVRVALVGLTHPNMPSLVGPMDRAGLNFRTPRLVQGEDTNFEWLEEMITMLRDPEGPYGVNAVVALTHTSSGNYSNMIVDRLQQRGNAHFDGFFSGHSHNTVNAIRTYGDLSTAVVLGGHHARGLGEIQLGFDEDGQLVHLQGNLEANVRPYEPDPEVFEWVHGVGATWEREGTGNNINLEISNQPSLDGDRADWGWEQVRDYWWGRPVGPRVTYATGSQHHRNQFLVNLLYDYVTRELAGDLSHTTGEPFAGTVIINNHSSWRGQDALELTWAPDDQVNTAQLMAALTFENTMPLFEIRGRDLIEMLNMPGANRGEGETNTPATPGRITDPESPFYGQPNWFTMQGSTVTGAFYQDGVWHMASTLEPISPDGIYRLGASNHLFGGYEQNGGQHWPLPGNNHGNALGFEVIDFIDGNTQFGAAYYRGPRRAIRDTETDMHITIQETWLRETAHRAELIDEGIALASWIEVEVAAGGEVDLAIWGLGTRTFPGASTHSGWGLPAYGAANNTTRDLVLNGSVVRATATIYADSDDVFLGWFADDVLVSRDEVFIFNAEGHITLEARFGEEVPPTEPPTVPPTTVPPGTEPPTVPPATEPTTVPSVTEPVTCPPCPDVECPPCPTAPPTSTAPTAPSRPATALPETGAVTGLFLLGGLIIGGSGIAMATKKASDKNDAE